MDFDQEVKGRSGLPIPEIFRQHGEGRFRELEEELGRELLVEDRVVLASGGGWPAAVGRMEKLDSGTFSVWLRVTPEEAVRRVVEEGPTRPLLAVDDPVGRARELLKKREVYYRKAEVGLDSLEGNPEDLARRIEQMMAESGRERLLSTST
jgi:shikimate kinase